MYYLLGYADQSLFLVLEVKLGEGSLLSQCVDLYLHQDHQSPQHEQNKSKYNVSSCPPKTREKGEKWGETQELQGRSSLPFQVQALEDVAIREPVGPQRKWSFLTLLSCSGVMAKVSFLWGQHAQRTSMEGGLVWYSDSGCLVSSESPIFFEMCNLKQITCLHFNHGINTFTQTAASQLSCTSDFRSKTSRLQLIQRIIR